MSAILGTDLSVVPNMVANDISALDLTLRTRVLRKVPPGFPDTLADLALIAGRENLAQALLVRLLTPQGTLATLGHASYGSRLHELIGRNKTEELRNLCRAFVLEAVAQEPRVENRVTDFRFERDQEQLDSFVFTVAVKPVDEGDPVTFSLEVGL